MSDFPRPVPPRPPIARQHCRHYNYVGGFPNGGPNCAVGIDLSAPGATGPCMPPDYQRGMTCEHRSDWTEKERAATVAWGEEHRERMILVLKAIPKDGYEGQLDCPACGTGKVRWVRARGNKHLHAACSTLHCFGIMQ